MKRIHFDGGRGWPEALDAGVFHVVRQGIRFKIKLRPDIRSTVYWEVVWRNI
jgi:hypothetical protein